MLEIKNRLLRADEVAVVLDVSVLRVYELARVGLLPCVRIGRQVRFAPSVLEGFVESGGRGLDEKPEAAAMTATGSPVLQAS